MNYLSGLETFILNATATTPPYELRINNINISHSPQAKAIALEYSLDIIKENGQSVDPRPFVIPGTTIVECQLQVREINVKDTLFFPSEDEVGGLCPNSLPTMVIRDFLNRIMAPNYVYKPLNFPMDGLDDNSWQEEAVRGEEFERYTFMPRYMIAKYTYDQQTEALRWNGASVNYQCLQDPKGRLNMVLDYTQYVEYVKSNKLKPIRLSPQ